MDFDIPSFITPPTLLRAARLVKNAESIKLHPGAARWIDEDDEKASADNIYFMFTNKDGTLVVVHCCPFLYFIEIFSNDDKGKLQLDYSFVKNIRHFLYWLKHNGYYDCEHMKRDDDHE